MKTHRPPFLTASVILTTVLACGSIARADEAALLRLLPGSANVVSIIRVERILESPRARSERWDQNRDQFLAGAGTVPAWARTVVLGSLVHPSVPEEVWTVAATQLPAGVELLQLADADERVEDRFSGYPAVSTPRGSLVVEYPGRLVAALLPSFRQDVARWVESTQTRQDIALSPWLQAAARSDDQIVLAMDVQDMLSPHRAEERLWSLPELKEHPQAVPQLLLALRRLRGVRMTVNVTTVNQARLELDFTEPVEAATPFLRSIVIAALNDSGIALDALETAEVTTDGSAVVLSTELPDDQLRMLLSLVLAPRAIPDRPLAAARPPAQTPPAPPAPNPGTRSARTTTPDAAASQRYFNTVSRAIDDLQRSSSRGTDPGRVATWHDNFAGKIEHLPTAGVDPALIEFGAQVASRFRALGASLRGAAIDVNTQQQSVTYDVHYDPGWAAVGFWGQMGYKAPSANVTSNLAEVRQRQAAAITRWTEQREQVWSLIQSDRTRIRQQMTTTFGREF